MKQHRWNIYAREGVLLGTIDAEKVTKWRDQAVEVRHNGAGIAIYFPIEIDRIEQEF